MKKNQSVEKLEEPKIHIKEAIKANTVIQCETEQEANRILGMAHELGYKWWTGKSYENNTEWNIYKSTMCYYLFDGSYSDCDYFKNRNYTIIPSTQIEGLEPTKSNGCSPLPEEAKEMENLSATELRIGNFISINFGNCDDGKIITVDGISDCEIYNEEHGYSPCNEFKPIPLTEQWLLDFGLEKYTGRYGVYYKHYALEGFRVWFPLDIYGWGYTVGRKDFETGDTYWVKNEVRYLHQLQNLFFALTQEELILKERSKEL